MHAPSDFETPIEDIFVINLERSPQRLATMNEQLTHYNLNYERFPAVDGYAFEGKYKKRTSRFHVQVLDHEKQYKYRYDPRKNRTGLSLGELGNYFSHFEVLRLIVKRGLKSALIFEDDAKLSDDFDKRLKSLMYHAPENWDIIYLHCFAESFGCKPDRFKQTEDLRFSILKGKNCTAGNAAYIVSDKGAQKLLQGMNPASDSTDTRIGKEFFSKKNSKLRAYCAHPQIVAVDPNDSIITNMGRNEDLIAD